MALEQTWRWFGPDDPIPLKEIKQVGAAGIVTALHHIPCGEIWTVDEIMKRKNMIEAEGLTWSVVESLPVHEDIKKRSGRFSKLIDNYKTSLRHLGRCGVDIVCYNFMPVLDWTRTDLRVPFRDGSIASRFEVRALAAFDLFALKRPAAERDYTEEQTAAAHAYFESLSGEQKEKLLHVVLLGLPGTGETFTLPHLQRSIDGYRGIGDNELRSNLAEFLRTVTPAAEESGILLAIHPDDPPRPLLGLPRVVSNGNDLREIIAAADSPHNGITFCTGSLGAGYENDCVALAKEFAHRINFIHLRNVKRNADGDFLEENHLEGDVDMFGVMEELLLEQRRRITAGRNDFRLPFRPDHGHLMLGDIDGRRYYTGYSLYGRMRGLAELRGLELGIRKRMIPPA